MLGDTPFREYCRGVDREDLDLGTTNQNPQGIALLELLREDLATHDGDLMSQGFWALAVHRLGNSRMDIKRRVVRAPISFAYRALNKFIEWNCGIKLSYTVRVGRRVRIWHFGGIVLGARAIGDDVHIRHNTTLGVARRGDARTLKPLIGDRVDIGTGAVIAGGVTVGDDSVVGANAVVLEDVPPGCLAVGVPARVTPLSRRA
jgi:serine O-acetyltransferase